jgi:2-polyprenyl-3-methyl-5-hydroxy-6-metoxy-1,4-benzoquinol methylase
MPDWQERITRETEPSIRAEHDLRYRLAAPLILSSSAWADLGCGHGLAASAALGDSFTGHAVLVDLDESVVRGAERELRAGHKTALAADLNQQQDLDRVRESLLGAGRDRVITCFEVVEHLEDFAPLVGMLVELAEAGEATSVLSVPNDAFWSIENPHHRAIWGEGAFAELLTLLPDARTIARQLSLNGSALLTEADESIPDVAQLELLSDSGAPTHFIVALGPRAGELQSGAMVAQTALLEQRRWERQRESDNAFFQAALENARGDIDRLVAERDELTAMVRANTIQFDQWRGYIADLEERLGLPRSGSPERKAFDAGGAARGAAPGELPPGDPSEGPPS